MCTYTIQAWVIAETNSGAYFFQVHVLVEANSNAHLFLIQRYLVHPRLLEFIFYVRQPDFQTIGVELESQSL